MKINSNYRLSRKGITKLDQPATHRVGENSFSDTMQQQQERASQEKLKHMLEQIQMQGDRLTKSMTMRELRAYKLKVRQFLEETARRGVSLKETRGRDRRGRARRYKLLEEIDRRLLEMTDELLEHEQGRIQILNGIGEIKGMLVNFLF